MAQKQKKLAIVLPGGGTKGVLQARLIKALDEKLKNIAEQKQYEYKGLGYHIDYIAGTSIGSMNAANTVFKQEGNLKFTTDENLNMFVNNAGNMLKTNGFLPLKGSFYSPEPVARITSERFEDKTFSNDNFTAKILINSFNLDTCCKTVFTNIGSEEDRHKLSGHVWDIDKIKLRDAVAASASVPGLLPAKAMEYQKSPEGSKIYHEVDGGLINNSPISELVNDMHILDKVDFKDMFIVSIGTGSTNRDLSHFAAKGPLSYFLDSKSILMGMLGAIQDDAEKRTENLIEANGGKFFNLNPFLAHVEDSGGMNDTKEQSKIYIDIAEKYITDNDKYFTEIAEQIIENCF